MPSQCIPYCQRGMLHGNPAISGKLLVHWKLSHTLGAQPLFWLEPHFHYFRLCSEGSNNELKDKGLLNSQTLSTVQSLLDPNLAWLGNVPIKDIARLWEEN